MVHGRDLALASCCAAVLAAVLSAQAPPAPTGPTGRGGRGAATTVVRSPEVHANRRVTFRLRAPDASSVHLVGEVLQGTGSQPMTKGGEGIWSVTIGPLPP